MPSSLPKFTNVNNLIFIALTSVSSQPLANSIFEPVVVTANRYAQNVSNTLASTTVITREDIEQSSAISLDDLLSSVNGIDVKSSGSFGKSSSIFMRGTNSSHVLTMVDGVKLFSATGGGTAYQHIPLSQIERIEIVRGPRSGLYGSEAIGGVIQIFTRKGKQESAADITIEQGSYNTSAINAGFSGSNGDLSYSLNSAQFVTDGIDSIRHDTENDDDGYNNRSLSTSFNYAASKTVKLNASILAADGTTLYDNCYNSSFNTTDNCYADIQQQVISTSAQFTPDSKWDGNLQIGYSKDLSDNFWNDTPNNLYITEHYSITFQNNYQATDAQLFIFGIDLSQDKVEANAYTDPFDETRDNSGLFISWNNNQEAIQTSISLRTDDNEQFGTHSTGTLSAGYKFNQQSSIYSSYATSFKAPSFNELYFPLYGDENLIPEKSESLEFGYRLHKENLRFEANIYQNLVDDLINYDSSISKANNISEAKITGAELSVTTTVSQWTINASTSYVEPLNEDDAYKGNILPGRVKSSTKLNMSRQFDSLNIALAIINQSKRFKDANNTGTLDAYTKADIKLTKKMNKNLSISTSINNIFDEDYALNGSSTSYYNTPGRSFFVSAQYRM